MIKMSKENIQSCIGGRGYGKTLQTKSIKATPVGKIGSYTLDYACEHGLDFYYTEPELEEAPTPNDMTDELSSVVDYLDKSIHLMDLYGMKSREQEIAKQKLEEAVFWLTYGMEE